MQRLKLCLLALAVLAGCNSATAAPTATAPPKRSSITGETVPATLTPFPKPTEAAAPRLGRARPIGRDCPPTHPIKGNVGDSGKIYHLPGGVYYGRTVPEECFAAEADARAAGYSRAQR